MLTNEQRKLRDKKSFFNSVVKDQSKDGQPGVLSNLKTELAQLKEAYQKLRNDVRSAVESEIIKAVKAKQNDFCNLPRQLDKGHIKQDEPLKKRERELNDREKELYEWETLLFQKNLQIEEMFEQYGTKMNKMAA